MSSPTPQTPRPNRMAVFAIAALILVLAGVLIYNRGKQKPQASKNESGQTQEVTDSRQSNPPTATPESKITPHSGSTPKVSPSESPKTIPSEIIAAPNTQPDGCYEITFKHKKLSSHSDGEACTQHFNLLTLPTQKISPQSICVRVNGRVVKHSLRSGEVTQVVFDPVAGPNSRVSARYCVGSARCSDPCKIEKDDFLDAIGASNGHDSDSDTLPTVHWDPKNPSRKLAKEESDLDTTLTGLNKALTQESERGAGKKIYFKDWLGGEPAAACAPQQARKG